MKDFNWDTDQTIKTQLVELISQNKIIPVIGSGFSRKCKAFNGEVPSGTDMTEYLKNFVAKVYGKTSDKYDQYSFSDLCTMYDKNSSKQDKFNYFSNNFTKVILEEEKKAFLKLFPKYMYTLNIDDGIEKNCPEYNVVLPRRNFSEDYVSTYSSLFKVHGDVHYYLNYMTEEELILNKRQYVESIKNNRKMLSKFQEDFSENNLLYIGCSLTEEPDLLSVIADSIKYRRSECQSIYVTLGVLDKEKKDLLEDYGITTCLVVSDINNFYREITYLAQTKLYENNSTHYEPQIIELNKNETKIEALLNSNAILPYPFVGKIYKPFFFTKRNIVKKVIHELQKVSPIHIIYGHRISGKTFCLIDIFETIKDKIRYFFPTNTKLTDDELGKLYSMENSLFLFDTDCLDTEQLFKLIKMKRTFIKQNNYAIVAVNTSDRNSIDLISEREAYRTSCVKNLLSEEELKTLNVKLQESNLPTFLQREIQKNDYRSQRNIRYYTILDNLCKISDTFSEAKWQNNIPDLDSFSSPEQLALLIILATQQVILSYDMFYFGLNDEARQLSKKFPVHYELTYSNEESSRVDSKVKLITNSRYILLKYLGDYALKRKNYPSLLMAYKYIYERIDSAESTFLTPRRMLDFIKFDVLNDVFYRKDSSVIDLIKYIYEGLEDVMNINPQFKHQRAKSIFWLCKDSHEEILSAIRYVELARYDTENILKSKFNDKLNISLEHIKYTQASIWGRLCNLESFENSSNILKSLEYYYEALNSYENIDELSDIKNKKAEKRIYEDLTNILTYVKNHFPSDKEEFHLAQKIFGLLE